MVAIQIRQLAAHSAVRDSHVVGYRCRAGRDVCSMWMLEGKKRVIKENERKGVRGSEEMLPFRAESFEESAK